LGDANHEIGRASFARYPRWHRLASAARGMRARVVSRDGAARPARPRRAPRGR
jgi:hypothetical protein